MNINVYNLGTVVSISERIENINVKDWRYYRHEEHIEPFRAVWIAGEDAKVGWLRLGGTSQAEVEVDAFVNIVRLDDESELTIKNTGKVHSVHIEAKATLIIEKGARRPDIIGGPGKVIDYNTQN